MTVALITAPAFYDVTNARVEIKVCRLAIR